MKTRYFNYNINLTEQPEGGYLVEFPDLPEAITQGDTISESLKEASDCLEEAIANRIVIGLPIPAPSGKKGKYNVSLSATIAAKAALYIAMRNQKINKIALAKILGCDEKEVRRLLDPYYTSKLPRIEKALNILGLRINIGIDKLNIG